VTFWDSSAVIPLCMEEPMTGAARDILEADREMAAWWGTPVECRSAFARFGREGVPAVTGLRHAIEALEAISRTWLEINPSERVRDLAIRVLSVHPLRAADSLQLAAALLWAGHSPRGRGFACLDRKLREAASAEGFIVLPEHLPAAG
jgi:predicted nucleic acid-binding protein